VATDHHTNPASLHHLTITTPTPALRPTRQATPHPTTQQAPTRQSPTTTPTRQTPTRQATPPRLPGKHSPPRQSQLPPPHSDLPGKPHRTRLPNKHLPGKPHHHAYPANTHRPDNHNSHPRTPTYPASLPTPGLPVKPRLAMPIEPLTTPLPAPQEKVPRASHRAATGYHSPDLCPTTAQTVPRHGLPRATTARTSACYNP